MVQAAPPGVVSLLLASLVANGGFFGALVSRSLAPDPVLLERVARAEAHVERANECCGISFSVRFELRIAVVINLIFACIVCWRQRPAPPAEAVVVRNDAPVLQAAAAPRALRRAAASAPSSAATEFTEDELAVYVSRRR